MRVGCSLAGALAAGCYSDEVPDAGVAFGAGFQDELTSRLTLTAEGIYYWGLGGAGEQTRIIAVQLGLTIRK